MQIVIATNNLGKKKEFKEMFSQQNISVLSLSDFPHIPEPPETHITFDDNARQKAEFVYRQIQSETPIIVIADDSGLCVEAINGEPGVFSKRYSQEQTDEANNQKLLLALKNKNNRKAFFHCSIAIVFEGGIRLAQGQCLGTIAHQLQGNEGFGYDPLFIPEDYPSQTLATLTATEKNTISHRGRALRNAIPLLHEIIHR